MCKIQTNNVGAILRRQPSTCGIYLLSHRIYLSYIYIYIISIYLSIHIFMQCGCHQYYVTSIPVQYLHSIRAKITCYILSSSPLVLHVQQPPRRMPAPKDACPEGCLPRRMPAPEDACPGGCLLRICSDLVPSPPETGMTDLLF